MKEVVMFSVGVSARVLAVVVEKYAAWLLDKIGDGAELGWNLVEDLRDFARWLLKWAASLLGGRRAYANNGYDDGYPQMYGRY
jgi:hypothetical protein